jgi:hypothetical protein
MGIWQRIKELTIAKIKHIASITGIIILSLVGYRIWQHYAKKTDKNITSTVLQPNQKRKEIIDPIKHQITDVTRDSTGKEVTHSTYLPDRPISIIETNDNKIQIEERKMGPETRPYLGGSFGDVGRFQLGLDVFYFRQFDLGLGLGFNPEILKDIKPNLNISYNFYSHTSVFIGIDNNHNALGGIKVRF